MREALARVLDSPEFVVPDRARRFLSYVVDEALCGRADRIKAFSIATDVLGRDSSFDGSTDPVVRIEAGRVRRALEHYYLTAGADDPVVITIPKGGYVPTFTRRQGNVEDSGRGAGLLPPGRPPDAWWRQMLGGAEATLLLALVAAIGLMAYVIFFRAAPPAEPGGAAALGVSRL
ncbi:MAG: adenylate cyclase, partial [Mesorhizobium sp.]